MRYTVEWRSTAEEALADIWLHADDRAAVRAAANRVDPELEVDPEIKGEEFYGDRLIVVHMLHVIYSVVPERRTVYVLELWAV
jgi:mRNA-degrading endonuclease RelE of RelBE toxin-antitoxin system